MQGFSPWELAYLPKTQTKFNQNNCLSLKKKHSYVHDLSKKNHFKTIIQKANIKIDKFF